MVGALMLCTNGGGPALMSCTNGDLLLTPFTDQHTNALGRAACSDAPCSDAAPTGQTGLVNQSDQSRQGSPTRIQRTPAREGPRRGRRTLGCPMLGRPARVSSNAIETRVELHVEVEKVG